jgi:hypothetical protein
MGDARIEGEFFIEGGLDFRESLTAAESGRTGDERQLRLFFGSGDKLVERLRVNGCVTRQ